LIGSSFAEPLPDERMTKQGACQTGRKVLENRERVADRAQVEGVDPKKPFSFLKFRAKQARRGRRSFLKRGVPIGAAAPASDRQNRQCVDDPFKEWRFPVPFRTSMDAAVHTVTPREKG
jgi:hypothetical protein